MLPVKTIIHEETILATTITIRDESTAGDVHDDQLLTFPEETLTVRELIRVRVYQEVQDFNRAKASKDYHGLVQPTDTERVLNDGKQAYRLKTPRQIDWKEQYEKAIEAFERHGYLILVDDHQPAGLDELFTIAKDTRISFIKLTPLVGG